MIRAPHANELRSYGHVPLWATSQDRCVNAADGPEVVSASPPRSIAAISGMRGSYYSGQITWLNIFLFRLLEEVLKNQWSPGVPPCMDE